MSTATETTPKLSTIDQALQTFREDMEDAKRQSQFYDLFLNTTFCVPTFEGEEQAETPPTGEEQVLPLIIESEGNDYLMIFDSAERLRNWTGTETKYVEAPGYVLAPTTMRPLHIAMNVGTEYSKQFLPDEITWLREVVEQCNAPAEKTEGHPG